jgi:hypothetical protein
MSIQKIREELKSLIEEGVKNLPVPYAKGNSIRIGSMVVRSSSHGHLVYDIEENKKIAHCFSKRAAIAIAKNIAEGRNKNIVREVKTIDDMLSKHYNDALFFKHGLYTTKEASRKDILETRLDISMYKVDACKHQLDQFIYN